jgi:hypothetical protein
VQVQARSALRGLLMPLLLGEVAQAFVCLAGERPAENSAVVQACRWHLVRSHLNIAARGGSKIFVQIPLAEANNDFPCGMLV